MSIYIAEDNSHWRYSTLVIFVPESKNACSTDWPSFLAFYAEQACAVSPKQLSLLYPLAAASKENLI